MTAQLTNTLLDIQFSGPDEQKLRRLVDEIGRLQRTLNAVIADLNKINVTIKSAPEVAPHAFIGPKHTFVDLPVGFYLKAITQTSAQFAQIAFTDLKQIDGPSFAAVEDGWVLTFVDGYYAMAPP